MKATYLDKNYPRKMKDSERLELIFLSENAQSFHDDTILEGSIAVYESVRFKRTEPTSNKLRS